MGWCCGLFGSGSRRSSPGQTAAARPAQTGLEGVEFSPRHSLASSEGGGHRPAQNGLQGVEFSPSQSFASSDGEGARPGNVMRPSKATQPRLPATANNTDRQNPELFGYYAPSSGLAQDSYEPQAPAPAPALAGLPPYRSAYQ
ncbi:uncharacterized protein PG998_012406 [Apiospora kogelbergensis]|uniref:Uncharacterized protein n=1 Tax=Apiospora kogelbergensis TaxID=1337665 RepID=A0AAW0QRU1_9PEZI